MQEVLALDDYYAIRASTPVRFALELSLAHNLPLPFTIARFDHEVALDVHTYMHASIPTLGRVCQFCGESGRVTRL